jgi:hypothetical protein
LETEIDTIIGKNPQGAIVTINDRATGILIKKKKLKKAGLVKQATIELLENRLFVYNNIDMETICNASRDRNSIRNRLIYKSSSWERGANEI